MSFKHLASVVLTASILSECGPPTEPQIPISQLRAASTVLVINRRSLPIVAEVLRDFEPGTGSRGTPLVAFFRLPDDAPPLTVTRIWVLLGDQVWSERASRIDASSTWMAGSGPEWPVGTPVEVVVQIFLLPYGSRLVRVPEVVIQAGL